MQHPPQRMEKVAEQKAKMGLYISYPRLHRTPYTMMQEQQGSIRENILP
jgi:hypothetical protein